MLCMVRRKMAMVTYEMMTISETVESLFSVFSENVLDSTFLKQGFLYCPRY